MTTSNLMSLPIDIVWKRLALDEEMMWHPPSGGSVSQYPPSWNPSVTIFYARPDIDSIPDEYANKSIIYLKVSASVTGTTPVIGEQMRGSSWPAGHPAAELLNNNLALYYGCYGAILDINVTPSDVRGIPIEEYPFFFDFQPKKREILEAVTLSGESLSDSKQSFGVRKSTTSLDGSELAQGILTPSIPRESAEFREEQSSVRNIDASRENRETYSYTTNTSQLYHQLNSYYLGTNRALFFLQPRPYFADPEFQTFVDGPRRLEGIQDFFLVVIQPKSQLGMCVEATLKTGHFAFNKIPDQPANPTTRPPMEATYFHSEDSLLSSVQLIGEYQKEWLYGGRIGAGWVLKTEVNKGQHVNWEQARSQPSPTMLGPGWRLQVDGKKTENINLIDNIIVDVDDQGLHVRSLIRRAGSTQDNDLRLGQIDALLTIYLKAEASSSVFSDTKTTVEFFVRRKTVSACLDPNNNVHPMTTHVDYQDRVLQRREGPFALMSGKAQSLGDINTQIIEAMRDTDEVVVESYGPGPIENPLHTRFALRQFQERVPGIDNTEWLDTRLEKLPEIPEKTKKRLEEIGLVTRAQLLRLSPEHFMRNLQINYQDACDLYLQSWDIPSLGQSE